jgi:initiation factor 1A
MPRESGFVYRQEGTHYGRVLRNLGHMNMLVYCNDGRQRICRIRGAMRRRMWIHVGDIVLVSYREYEVGAYKEVGEEKGDILHRYETTDHNRLRADPQFQPALLLRLEAQADLSRITAFQAGAGAGAGAGAMAALSEANPYLFSNEVEDDEEDAPTEEDDSKERFKAAKSRAEEARRVTGLQKKTEGVVEEDEIDISAI